MKNKLITLLLVLAAMTFTAQAQDKPTVKSSVKQTKPTTEKLTAKTYEDLLDKLKKRRYEY